MEKNKPTKIFIVEDDVMYGKFLQKALEQKEYEVDVFQTGEQMISSWEEDPDVILLDYFIESHLGVAMNGEKILRFIRRISKSLPVIALTATPDIGKATGMLKLGAVDFIVKDKEVLPNLQKTISQVLEARKLREELTRNKMQVKKYRQRFVIIVLIVALAAMTLLWLYS
jgi:DNA-binding NtrC family response regulator